VNSQMLMLKNLKSNASTNIYKCHHEWSTNAFKLLGSIRMYIGSLTMPWEEERIDGGKKCAIRSGPSCWPSPIKATYVVATQP
jgi:hypothetical protein